MTTTTEIKLVVFFSWQSDSPKRTNHVFIQKALSQVAHDLLPHISLEIQQAVREVPGSPSIDKVVLERIVACDVFVGDVSIVGMVPAKPKEDTPPSTAEVPAKVESDGRGKGLSNPNVMFEAGYAMALHGDSRVILVANVCDWNVKELPFDIRSRSVIVYDVGHNEPKTTYPSKFKNFVDNLTRALRLIAEQNPERPVVSIAKTVRLKDLNVIRKVLRCVPSECAETLVLASQSGRVWRPAHHCSTAFTALIDGFGFYLHDRRLRDAVETVGESLKSSLSHSSIFVFDDVDHEYSRLMKFDECNDSTRRDKEFAAYLEDIRRFREDLRALRVATEEVFPEEDWQSLDAESWLRFSQDHLQEEEE